MSDPFELLAGQFVSSIALSVPAELRPMVFSSTSGARDPDVCLLWHSGYREKNKLKLLFSSFAKAAISCFRGMAKILLRYEPFGYALYGTIGDSVLVVTSTCGYTTKDDGYKTDYVSTDWDDGLFVFGFIEKCGKNAEKVNSLSVKEKVWITLSLAAKGVRAFFNIQGEVTDKTLLLWQWLSWILGLQWLHNYYLQKSLSEIVEKYGIKKIGCIHEMHSYSRMVWGVASKYNIKGYTVQHAAISRGKKWYFVFRGEIQSGVALPDVFYVFEKRMSGLLEPYYKNTRFALGCSYRYSRWINVRPEPANDNGYYLFVGALADFDNSVLIESLDRLLSASDERIPLRLRLHPYADLSRKMKQWVKAQAKRGRIELSEGTPLSEDIKGAKAVIGMSTTVLEESLLLGRPVIQLTHPDYLEYMDLNDMSGATKLSFDKLSAHTLRDAIYCKVDSAGIRRRLGLDQPLLTYKQLFL